MFAFTDLRDQLAHYLSQQEVEEIAQAYLMAAQAHEGQKRYTGEPYISHPIEVARILAGLHMDHQSIIAAMLHDVIEDTLVDKQTIISRFGEKVAELVDGVSKLKQISFESRELAQAQNFRKMMLAMAKDIRVILIKLADRLHNMRTLGALPPPKRRRIALETLEIYAPIAHRLGINYMRVEFEDLGFAALYPLRYRVLKEAVRRAKGNRKQLIKSIEKALTDALEASGVRQTMVWGREKHLYSLYKKMHKKRLSLSEVMDVYAFRIIVHRIEDCYAALGAVHRTYRPIPRRFKDYIAVPKANGYQSLHTILIGPHGVPMEVQIRTQDMERFAENGIAAHWLYKESEQEKEKERKAPYTGKWLAGLLEIQKNTGDPIEFIQNVKTDLFSDDVYVFTPKGNILTLPQGATPVDFAYQVHTDIGDTCISCKIDRRTAPLSTRLKSGQMVEIVTQKGAHPNPAWLSFSATGKARSSIRQWLRSQQRTEALTLGKRLLNEILLSMGIELDAIDPKTIKKLVTVFCVANIEELFEDVGFGKRMASLTAQRILNYQRHTCQDDESTESCIVPLCIQGTEGLVVTYAKCCHPIPGDLIIGQLVFGQGITIHREKCPKMGHLRHDRQHYVNVAWEQNVAGEYDVPIIVEVINARGLLATLAASITECEADIVNVHVDEQDGRHNEIRFIVRVHHRAHLARILQKLRTITEVIRIARGK